MKSRYRCVTFLAAAILFTGVGFAQGDVGKKSYMFRGKIEAVDENAKSLKVNGEEVKGWMAAMTMDYKVDDQAVLKKVKPGDQITATVYDGDPVLHKVQVMPKQTGESKSKK